MSIVMQSSSAAAATTLVALHAEMVASLAEADQLPLR
jgi:hypothetical protein